MYGKLICLDGFVGLFVCLDKLIDFDVLDDEFVDLMFLFLVLEGVGVDYLKVLVWIV